MNYIKNSLADGPTSIPLEQASDPIPELPVEIWNHIINYIDNAKTLKSMAQLNHSFNQILIEDRT